MYKIAGSVLHVSEVKQVTEKFRTRDLVLFVDGQFPTEVKITAFNDRCDLLSGLTHKAEISVNFGVTGKSFVSKQTGQMDWINTLVLINLQKV